MLHFDPVQHKYTDKENNVYTSMTSLIGKYSPKFEDDSDYWLTYKAIQYLSGDIPAEKINKFSPEIKDKTTQLCQEILGMDYLFTGMSKVLTNSMSQKRIMITDTGLLGKVKEIIAKSWSDKGDKSRTDGTAFHLKQESIQETTYKKTEYKLDNWNFDHTTNLFNFTPGKMYNEVILANKEHLISGTADRIHSNKGLLVRDHKTNETIDTQGFRGERLLYPLNNFQNCSLDKYTIQLSGYAYMLECLGYKIECLEIDHYTKTSEGQYKLKETIPIVYQKDLIIELFKHHKASL